MVDTKSGLVRVYALSVLMPLALVASACGSDALSATTTTDLTPREIVEFPINDIVEDGSIDVVSGPDAICHALSSSPAMRRLSSAVREVFDERNESARQVLLDSAIFLEDLAQSKQGSMGDAAHRLAASLEELATAGPSERTVSDATQALAVFGEEVGPGCAFE